MHPAAHIPANSLPWLVVVVPVALPSVTFAPSLRSTDHCISAPTAESVRPGNSNRVLFRNSRQREDGSAVLILWQAGQARQATHPHDGKQLLISRTPSSRGGVSTLQSISFPFSAACKWQTRDPLGSECLGIAAFQSSAPSVRLVRGRCRAKRTNTPVRILQVNCPRFWVSFTQLLRPVLASVQDICMA
jgi:hypothetical protein